VSERTVIYAAGPCAFCGDPDALHRVRDSMRDRLGAGEPEAEVAWDFGVSVEDMYVVLRGGPTRANPIRGHQRPTQARRTPEGSPTPEPDLAGLRDAEKRPVKSPQARADELFSRLIRARDQRCQNCNDTDWPQCAHIWSRKYRATRWRGTLRTTPRTTTTQRRRPRDYR